MSNPMGLTIPTVSVTPGPDYANEVNADLGLIAEHDHTDGNGVPVPAAGLNINADLPFGSNNATGLRSVRFTNNGSPLAGGTDAGCAYESGGDLWYNDGEGNQIQITRDGSLNASAIGGISGMAGTAAAVTYDNGQGTFEFTTGPDMDGGIVAGRVIVKATDGKQITISADDGMAADYDVKLPVALPGASAFVTLDAAGQLATPIPTALGIDTANLAASAVTTVKIADANVTKPKLAALGNQASAEISSGTLTSSTYASITSATVTLTTTGRPVFVGLIARATAGGVLRVTETSGSPGTISANLALTDNAGSEFAVNTFGATVASNGQMNIPPGSFWYIYTPAAGAHVLQLRYLVGANSSMIFSGVLVAYEL